MHTYTIAVKPQVDRSFVAVPVLHGCFTRGVPRLAAVTVAA